MCSFVQQLTKTHLKLQIMTNAVARINEELLLYVASLRCVDTLVYTQKTLLLVATNTAGSFHEVSLKTPSFVDPNTDGDGQLALHITAGVTFTNGAVQLKPRSPVCFTCVRHTKRTLVSGEKVQCLSNNP